MVQEPAELAGLDALRWLLGDWVSEGEGDITYESWRRGDDGTLEGVGRSVSRATGEGRTIETLRLVAEGGEILYVATVAHNPGPVAFALAEQNPRRFVFENPAHDFPTRIVYEHTAAGRMRVTVSGPDAQGFVIEFDRLARP